MILFFSFQLCKAQPLNDSLKKEINGKQNSILTPQQMVDRFLHNEKTHNIDSFSNKETVFDNKLDSLKLKAWMNYYSYMSFGYEHRKRVFYWQLVSSEIIFFVVICLVLVGVYFAWLQFYHTLKYNKKDGDPDTSLSTELSASFKEIKIVSPVLGVIILIISFMFFYLYLRYVYPIDELF